MQLPTKIDKDYLNWFSEIKNKNRSTQIRAALAANATLIEFYYDLGGMIVKKQAQSAWGDKLVQQLSKDLQAEFPGMLGFSYTNLRYCKDFYKYFIVCSKIDDELQFSDKQLNIICPQVVGKLQTFDNKENIIVPQLGGQLSPESGKKLRNLVFNTPWGHILHIINKVKDLRTAIFYLQETQKNAWSRDVLALQIKNQLHKRQGKAITNFSLTLPTIEELEQSIK